MLQIHVPEVFAVLQVGWQAMGPPKRGVLVTHQNIPQLWTVTNQNKIVGDMRYVEHFSRGWRSELDTVMHQQVWPPLRDDRRTPRQLRVHFRTK